MLRILKGSFNSGFFIVLIFISGILLSYAFFHMHAHMFSWVILLCGVIITFILTGYVFGILNRARHIESLIKERTRELSNLNEELKNLSRKNELILSSAGEGILGVDTDGRHTFLNPMALEMLGYTPEELIGEGSHQIWHYSKVDGGIYKKEGCPICLAFKDGKVYYGKNEIFFRKDGSTFYVDYISKPIISDEKIIGAVVTFRDITERRLAEEKIKQAAQEWERTFNAITDLVFIQDRNNFILKANKACLKALKMKPEDVIGRKCYEVFHGLNEPFPGCPFEKTKKDEKAHTEEIFDPKIGIPLLVTTSPIFNDAGRMIGSVHISKDISRIKEVERKMEEALEIESDFISTVSHELRTPLSAMKEAINLVSEGLTGPVTGEQQEFLIIAKRNVERLTRLINDVLDFKKLESGRVIFDMQDNSINEVVEEIKDTMIALAQNKGLSINFELDVSIKNFKFDRDMIIQVLTNIINNAIKFTENGGINISTKKEANYVTVAIKDTGPGIKKEDIPKLFQKFSQLEKGISRKTGGTGLGLAISKEIIEKHGGKIWIESEFSKGTTFYFTLPNI